MLCPSDILYHKKKRKKKEKMQRNQVLTSEQRNQLTKVIRQCITIGSDHLPVLLDTFNHPKLATFNCLAQDFTSYMKNERHVFNTFNANPEERIKNVVNEISRLVNLGYLVCLQELCEEVISLYNSKHGRSLGNISYSQFKNKTFSSRVGFAFDKELFKVNGSETLDTQFIISKNKQCYRVAFTDVLSKQYFYVVNVHMPMKATNNVREYNECSEKLVIMLKAQRGKSSKGVLGKLYLTGDFNASLPLPNEKSTFPDWISTNMKHISSTTPRHISGSGNLVCYDHIFTK